MSGQPNAPTLTTRPNPWAGCSIIKIMLIRSGSPIAFFSVHFPLLELVLVDCTLRRTKLGRLWCSPAAQRNTTTSLSGMAADQRHGSAKHVSRQSSATHPNC